MSSESAYTDSPLVDELINAIIDYDISITNLPLSDELKRLCLREVKVLIKGHIFQFLIDNEYGDADENNLPLKLNMVLMEIADYAEVSGFPEWAKGNGFSENSIKAHEYWGNLQNDSIHIRNIIRPEIEPVSSWNWSMNSGDIQILRNLPSRLKRPDLQAVWLEIWVDELNSFNFAAVESCFSDTLRLRRTNDLSKIFATYKKYEDVTEHLHSQNFFLVKDTLFPERVFDGQIVKTGEWFEYWYHDLTAGKDILIVRQIEGEEIQVFPTPPKHSPIFEFHTYEETCLYLWQEDFVKASGRCKL